MSAAMPPHVDPSEPGFGAVVDDDDDAEGAAVVVAGVVSAGAVDADGADVVCEVGVVGCDASLPPPQAPTANKRPITMTLRLVFMVERLARLRAGAQRFVSERDAEADARTDAERRAREARLPRAVDPGARAGREEEVRAEAPHEQHVRGREAADHG